MFPKRLDRPEMLCDESSPIVKVTDSGLKFLVIAKCNMLQFPDTFSSTTTYAVTDPKAVVLFITSRLALVGYPGWLYL